MLHSLRSICPIHWIACAYIMNILEYACLYNTNLRKKIKKRRDDTCGQIFVRVCCVMYLLISEYLKKTNVQ